MKLLRTLLTKIRSRLAFRIYVVGVIQFAIVAAATVFLAHRLRPPPSTFTVLPRYVGEAILAVADDPVELAEATARARENGNLHFTLYDADDRRIAESATPPDTHPSNASLRTLALRLRNGKTGRIVYAGAPPHGAPPEFVTFIPVALVVLGVFSWLTARSVAEPLRRLSRATEAFGAGDLGVRMDVERVDEIGDVARAFDEMVARVTKALRAEKELLANVSHELRTPLQRIHIAVDLAREGNAEMARESLLEIAEDLADLERIVEDVLTAARLSLRDGPRDGTTAPSSVPPIHPETIDAAALLEKSIARFRVAHPQRPLRVSIAPLPPIDADPVLLRRVVDNLLENAHKYTEAVDHEVAIAAARRGERIVVEVADRGIGIATDDLERVFEPFFRVDRSRARATGGLGLGLPLARQIVEAHGGALSLESALGAGTVVRVELPIPRDGGLRAAAAVPM